MNLLLLKCLSKFRIVDIFISYLCAREISILSLSTRKIYHSLRQFNVGIEFFIRNHLNFNVISSVFHSPRIPLPLTNLKILSSCKIYMSESTCGWGIYAQETIVPGSIITSYVGEYVTSSELAKRRMIYNNRVCKIFNKYHKLISI